MNTLFIYSFMIVLMFLLSGINKIQNIQSTAESLQKRVNINLPFFTVPFELYTLAIIIVILLQILGSMMILKSAWTGKNNNIAYWSAIALAGFTIIATMLYHFPPVGKEYYTFMSNLAVTGGLLILADRFN